MNDIPDDLMEKYKREIPGKLEALKALVDNYPESRDDLQSFFHKLKGSSCMYGHIEVSIICGECEEKIKNGDDVDASELNKVLEKIRRGFYE